jgi:signal transduction histidine kinase
MQIPGAKILLLVLLFICAYTGYTQNQTVDSLLTLLKNSKEDTVRVNNLNKLSKQYLVKADHGLCIEFATKALILADKLHYDHGSAIAHKLIGEASLDSQADFNEAIEHLNVAFKLFAASKDQPSMVDCYLSIGEGFFHYQFNIPEAQQYFLKAQALLENLGDRKRLAHTFRFLSMAYGEQGDTLEALKTSLSALKIYQEIKDSNSIAYTCNIVGDIYLSKGRLDSALHSYFTALAVYKILAERAQSFGIPWTHGNIGGVYMKQGELAYASGNGEIAFSKFLAAKKNFDLRLKLEQEGKMSHKVSYNNLGNCHLSLSKVCSPEEKNKHLEKSEFFLNKSLQVAMDEKFKPGLRYSYASLSDLYSMQGKYKEALTNYKLSVLYEDSLLNEESNKKILQARLQFDFDKKEALAKAKQDQRDSNARLKTIVQYCIIGIFCLVAVFLYLSNRQKQKSKTKIQNAYSELQSTQAQLLQSEKMASLGELTAGIAHEIQNPLNFMNNFSEINTELIDEMKKEIDNGNISEVKVIANDIKENEGKINHHGKRADAIVKNMLQHSRSTSGKRELTGINALVEEYLRLAYHSLRAKDNSFSAIIKTDFDKTIGNINIIPEDIGRVFLNLYNNAFYAIHDKKKLLNGTFEPTVFVTTKRFEKRVELSVKDNGNGILQNVADKIFQPFFTTKPTGEGTGLGLSLAYDIVKAHGGEIKVETKKGEYANFIVVLPLVILSTM